MTDIVYTCSIHGVPDQRLAGYGHPPSCPTCQLENPGRGAFPMYQDLASTTLAKVKKVVASKGEQDAGI